MEHSWIKARRKKEEKNNTHTHTRRERKEVGTSPRKSPDDPVGGLIVSARSVS